MNRQELTEFYNFHRDKIANGNLEGQDRIATSIFCLAIAVAELGNSIETLGVNSADTNMGGLELVAKEIRDGFTYVSSSLGLK